MKSFPIFNIFNIFDILIFFIVGCSTKPNKQQKKYIKINKEAN